ncbi:MAG: hypothetical protein V1748_00420 [Actinomycetota bacterium]
MAILIILIADSGCMGIYRIAVDDSRVVTIEKDMSCAEVLKALGPPQFEQPDKFLGAVRWVYQYADLRHSVPEYRVHIVRLYRGKLHWVISRTFATPWAGPLLKGPPPCSSP